VSSIGKNEIQNKWRFFPTKERRSCVVSS